MAYDMLVVFKEVYRVHIDAEYDEETAEELAYNKVREHGDDPDAGVELLSDSVDITLDNNYD